MRMGKYDKFDVSRFYFILTEKPVKLLQVPFTPVSTSTEFSPFRISTEFEYPILFQRMM
jgi:hypothetical protein